MQERHPNWPWKLMYQDLLWAMEKLQDPKVSSHEYIIAAIIIQAWIGEIENLRVFQQQSQHQQPVVE